MQNINLWSTFHLERLPLYENSQELMIIKTDKVRRSLFENPKNREFIDKARETSFWSKELRYIFVASDEIEKIMEVSLRCDRVCQNDFVSKRETTQQISSNHKFSHLTNQIIC